MLSCAHAVRQRYGTRPRTSLQVYACLLARGHQEGRRRRCATYQV